MKGCGSDRSIGNQREMHMNRDSQANRHYIGIINGVGRDISDRWRCGRPGMNIRWVVQNKFDAEWNDMCGCCGCDIEVGSQVA